MSYEVIARKWRPQQFDEVIGQSHITQTLKNEIANGRIAHAFLFSGTRGVGKTTTARILAKALNCRKENKPTPIPCDTCDACLDIKQGVAVDVLEIDGASNRGIDEIRELREGVKYAPAKLRYKVYIIDEVHMLTREAFNALLKTLEEPPKHVIFVLATTDVHKIPITILSRCQRFDFRRVSLKELVASLRHIAESESVQIDEQSLVYIAKASEGSIRDAQSLLDQVISYSGAQVHHEEVRTLLGVIGQGTLRRFAEVILAKKTGEIFELVADLTLHGYDLGQFCKELIEYFRNLIIIKLVPSPDTLIEEVSLDLESLREQANSLSLQELQQIFKFLLETESELKRTSYPRFALEMALVRATQLATLEPLEALLEKIYQLEEKLTFSGSTDSENSPDLFSGVDSRSKLPSPSMLPEPLKPIVKNDLEPGLVSTVTDSERLGTAWQHILNVTERIKPSLNSTLKKGRMLDISRQAITIGFSINSSFAKEKVEEPDSLKIIRDILREEFKITPKIKVTFLKEEEPVVPEDGNPVLKEVSMTEQPVASTLDSGEQVQRLFPSGQQVPEENEQKVLEKVLQLFDGKIPE